MPQKLLSHTSFEYSVQVQAGLFPVVFLNNIFALSGWWLSLYICVWLQYFDYTPHSTDIQLAVNITSVEAANSMNAFMNQNKCSN